MKLEGMKKFTVLNCGCPFCDGETTRKVLEKYPNTWGKTLRGRLYHKRTEVSCSNGHVFEVFFKRVKREGKDSDIISQEVTVVSNS